MTYYRFSNSQNPMSEWGHAMFAENRDSVQHYGDNEYHFNEEKGINIEDLHDLIVNAWEKTVEYGLEPIGFEELEAEEIYNEFNPDDIVMSAQAWDCTELLEWFCENVAIPNDIQAVVTNDGAIVFEEELIQEA